MQIVSKIKIDLMSHANPQIVEAMQYDMDSRAVEIHVYSGGVPWTVPRDAFIAFAYSKPDGTKGLYDKLADGRCAVSASGTAVTAILAPQVLTACGEVKAVIVLTDTDGKQLSTLPFVVNVDANPAGNVVASTDYFNCSIWETVTDAVIGTIGNLADLETSDKSNLVAAINEAFYHGGGGGSGGSVALDKTLTKEGEAADAKAVGTALEEKQPKGDYALKTEIPAVHVQSVNGKTGAVRLTAEDVDALPSTTKIPQKTSELKNDSGYLTDYSETDPTVPAWAKAAQKPTYTAAEVGADPKGTAANAVSAHNTDTAAHEDIRALVSGLTERLNALANSDDETLDQMAEIVAYIKSNRTLIEQVTTGKVSVSDIVDNLTTNVANKPLSAAQGVALKKLIDAIVVPTKVSQLANDAGYLTQHQDISGKLDADKLPEAVNTALAQAKASGEFDGEDGDSVTVTSVTESTADGGSNVVKFSDGKTVTIKNGSKGNPGKDGEDGEDGYTPLKGVDYWTDSDKQEILEELETDYTTVPDYVRTEAEKVARIINQHQSGDSIVFPFLADAHCGYDTDKNNDATRLAGQLLALIGERVSFDFVANGGDMANGAWDTTREKTYQQIEDYTELTADGQRGVLSLWMPGNHEDAPYMATAERASQTDMFALVGRKSRVSGADCPAGCNYGFLDLENRKLRVIYLDTDDKRSWGTAQVGNGESAPAYLNAHNVGGKQLQWLAETALDFTGKTSPEEWSIVVLSHVALNVSGTITDSVSGTVYANSTANAATILDAYKKGKSGSITHNDITVSYDFSKAENRAVIVCYIHGHNHAYREEQIGTIQSVGCPNVMNGRDRESTDGTTYTKTAGTADGTSFCIITLDRENAMLYADHVGVGYDREWQYTIETVSYTNQLPIATDASGNVYNGVGYKADTYLSGGSEGSRSGIYATGYIPCENGDILYCKNVGMQTNQDAHRLVFFDSGKNYLNVVKTTATAYPGFVYGTDGNISSIRIAPSGNTGTAYIRLCCSYLGEDSVITVNEPIE